MKSHQFKFYQLLGALLALTALSACESIPLNEVEGITARATSVLPVVTAFERQAEAQDVINRAVDAAGGVDAISGLRNGKFTFSTRAARVGQAPTPEATPVLGDASRTVGIRNGSIVAIERFNGENLGSRYIHGDLVDWIYFAGNNTLADVEPVLASGIINQVTTSNSVLLDLLDRSEFVRTAGRLVKDGKTYNQVEYADRLGRLQTVSFDSETGLLNSMQLLSAHAQWGDIASELTFSDYRDVNGVQLSHLVTTKQAGLLVSETRLEATDFSAIDSAVFERPKDATVNDAFRAGSTAPRNLTVETLADDIYYIANAAQGYNVVFVDQADGILILETPQSTQSARDIVRTVNQKLPGKSIKAAVPTHHHFDHSGGIYGFLESGVSILTTPGNVDFVNDIRKANRHIGQNTGAKSGAGVDSFDGRTTLGNGSNRIELINVGPNPHAEEIVIAYIPAIKAIFVADIFSFRGENLPPANANQLAFAERLEALNLDVETFIPVHGVNATSDQFWDSVKRGRTAQSE